MRKDLIPSMEKFNAMTRSEQIDVLCAVYECPLNIRKIHFQQYVNRRWNPHPPQRFLKWWAGSGVLFTEKRTCHAWALVGAVDAFNCEVVREAYREAKQLGLA